MNIYIVAATDLEIAYVRERITSLATSKDGDFLVFEHCCISFFVHGVGGLRTSYYLSKIKDADLIVQIGIAGSFQKDIALGSCVEVVSDQMGDEGAEDHADFLDLLDLGFTEKNELPFQDGKLVNTCPSNLSLPKVNCITVNTVSGNADTIARRENKYHAAIETMEGAYFFYYALQEKIPFVQFRGISNYVTKRDKSTWQIKAALKSVHDATIEFLTQNNFIS